MKLAVPHLLSPNPKDELWRYVKLSTLFMMLRGKAFIPTLAQLQKDDPTEGLIGVLGEKLTCTASVDEHFAFLREHLQSLVDSDYCTVDEKIAIKENKDDYAHSHHAESLLHKVWVRGLGKRRCIWCWHLSRMESMACWNIYARQGVAVSSDLESIHAGLNGVVPAEAYVIDYSREFSDSITETLPPEERLLALRSPHLFKQRCYEHEKEVRLVFRTLSREEGVEMEINPNFIKKIVLSPYMASSEAAAIQEVIEKLKCGDERLKAIDVTHSITRSNMSAPNRETGLAIKNGLSEKVFDLQKSETNIFPYP